MSRLSNLIKELSERSRRESRVMWSFAFTSLTTIGHDWRMKRAESDRVEPQVIIQGQVYTDQQRKQERDA